MHYWRKGMIDALRRTAADASGDEALDAYATYCQLREQGLRKQALAHVADLAGRLSEEPFLRRQRFVGWVLRQSLEGQQPSDGMLLLPYPLVRRLIEPTVLDWTRWEPENPEPHFWLGMLSSGHGTHTIFVRAAAQNFRDALARDPSYEPALQGLIRLEQRFG
ncbi:MAG: hypothetical protein AAGG50_19710 [Bacteroidota bacterium]